MTTRTSLATLVLASLLPAAAAAQQEPVSTVRIVAGNIVEVDAVFGAPDTCHRIVQADAGAPPGMTPPEDAIPATVTISRETGGEEDRPAEMAPSDMEPAPDPTGEIPAEGAEADTEAEAEEEQAGQEDSEAAEPAPADQEEEVAEDEAAPAAPGAVPMDEEGATLPETPDPGDEAPVETGETDDPAGMETAQPDPIDEMGEAPIVRQACEDGLIPLQSSFALSLEGGKNAVQIYFLDRGGEVIETERVEFSD